MCSSDNCCYFLSLEIGCLILGFITFIISVCLSLASIILLHVEYETPGRGVYHLDNFPQIHLSGASINIVLYSILLVAGLWAAFSLMLLIGIKRDKTSFVLSYFSYSILVTMLAVLSSLLLLLQSHWIMSLTLVISSLVNTHGLMVVHTTYNLMLSGAKLNNRRQLSDEEILVDDRTDELL